MFLTLSVGRGQQTKTLDDNKKTFQLDVLSDFIYQVMDKNTLHKNE